MAYRRWHNHLSDESDGNENDVDAIVCDYELFMLFHKRGNQHSSQPAIHLTNERTNERMNNQKNGKTNELKKVVLKLKYNIWELHGKAIKNICTSAHLKTPLSMAVKQQSALTHALAPNITRTVHTQSTHEITVNEVQRRYSTFFPFFLKYFSVLKSGQSIFSLHRI